MSNYIHRDLEGKLLEMARYFPVLVVTGPRQSGKSTLIRHLFGDYDAFSLEDYDAIEGARSDPRQFLQQNRHGMIIDEVQNVPELLSYIQGIVDRDPSKRFVLSGSVNFTLLKSVTQSLAGRAYVADLLPLSLHEIAASTPYSSTDELLLGGLYPGVVARHVPAQDLYRAYTRTYLERDVRDLLKVKDLLQFNTFLRICAGRAGQLFNASQIAGEVGVAVNTIKSWLSVLVTSYVVYLLPPYYENINKRLTKTPKLYMCDTGLACSLLGITSARELAHHSMRGALFENLVVIEALKHQMNQGKENNLYFYRDANGNEIDLLIREGEAYTGLEIKSAMTYNKTFASQLKRMEHYVHHPIRSRAVVYNGPFELPEGEVKVLNYLHLDKVLP